MENVSNHFVLGNKNKRLIIRQVQGRPSLFQYVFFCLVRNEYDLGLKTADSWTVHGYGGMMQAS